MRRHGLRILTTFTLCLALSGCYVAFSGHASSSGGNVTSTSSGSVVPAGSSGVSVAFGSLRASGGAGGQVSFGRSTSAIVVLGMVIAESVNYFSGMLRGRRQAELEPGPPISSTCSCYGWQPELTLAPATQ